MALLCLLAWSPLQAQGASGPMARPALDAPRLGVDSSLLAQLSPVREENSRADTLASSAPEQSDRSSSLSLIITLVVLSLIGLLAGVVIWIVAMRRALSRQTGEMRKRAAQLEAILACMGDALIVHDTDSRILTINAAALRIFRWRDREEAQEVLRRIHDGEGLVKFYDAEGTELALEESPLARAVRREPFENEEVSVVVPGTGKSWTGLYSGQPVRDIHGDTGLFITTIYDITQQKRAEKSLVVLNRELARINDEMRQEIRERSETELALRESEERYRLIGESLDYGVWVANAEGHWVYASPAFLKLVGKTQSEIQEFGWMECLPAEDAKSTLRKWMHCVDTGQDWDQEHRFLAETGETVTVLARGKPVRDRDGHIFSWVGINLDITERKKMEQELLHLTSTLEERVQERTRKLEQQTGQLRLLAQQLTEVEQRERRHLAELLHDHLQQLLVAAKMRVDIASRKAEGEALQEGLQESARLIDEAIQESRSLTAELRPPVLYEDGLGSALKWLAGKMGDQYDLYVHLDIRNETEPRRDFVKAMLYHAARELLFNVVKYAGVEQARLALQQEEGLICLTVSDEGHGFRTEDLEQEKEGSGRFGLFSIRERLKVIGGRIDIQSSPGEGSTFRIYVPLEKSDETAPRPSRGEAGPADRAMPAAPDPAVLTEGLIRVIVADDHQIVREGIANLLDDEPDISVVGQASDGQAAIELARNLRPDVIVMDVNMPRVNGIEATRTLFKELPETCVVGLSVHDENEVADAMKKAGAAAYVSKGEAHENLIETIRACVLPPARK